MREEGFRSQVSAPDPEAERRDFRAALVRAIRSIDEMVPTIAFRPDRTPIVVGFEHLPKLAEEQLRVEREEFARWVDFMIAHDWLADGFPRGDVY